MFAIKNETFVRDDGTFVRYKEDNHENVTFRATIVRKKVQLTCSKPKS